MTAAAATDHRAGVRALAPSAERVGIRAAEEDGEQPILFGHFARFNEWTEIDSWIEGHFMERIAPTAFDKTFKENRDRIRVLFQHGRDPEVGDKPIAEPQVMKRDGSVGAYYEARLFDGLPDLILDGLRAGQYGASFKMTVMREEVQQEPGTSDHNPQGIPESTIKEIRLHEFGPVTFPAYEGATAEVRSMTDDLVFDALKREPERFRSLLLSPDLSRHALGVTEAPPAPSEADRSAEERRDRRTRRSRVLEDHDRRPSRVL